MSRGGEHAAPGRLSSPHSNHGPTLRELEFVALWESGLDVDVIAQTMGIGMGLARKISSRMSMQDSKDDKRFWSGIRVGSLLLGEAVNAAGGHR